MSTDSDYDGHPIARVNDDAEEQPVEVEVWVTSPSGFSIAGKIGLEIPNDSHHYILKPDDRRDGTRDVEQRGEYQYIQDLWWLHFRYR
jgi:hypothetical protein